MAWVRVLTALAVAFLLGGVMTLVFHREQARLLVWDGATALVVAYAGWRKTGGELDAYAAFLRYRSTRGISRRPAAFACR
jgi:hypothetical protein